MSKYLIFAGNINDQTRGFDSFWCAMDDREKALEYADWLCTMGPCEPEAKADWSQVVDGDTLELIESTERTVFREGYLQKINEPTP